MRFARSFLLPIEASERKQRLHEYEVTMSERFRIALAVAVLLLLLVAGQTKATTISGVEFSNWTMIDVPGGVDLDLSTLGNLYVFVPNGLFIDQLTMDAEFSIVFEQGVSVDLNDPVLCDVSCEVRSFAEDRDIVLQMLDPMGSVTLSAQSIVVSSEPIPEPSTLCLLALGLSGLAFRRNDAPCRRTI
jgi:hypothetical protein